MSFHFNVSSLGIKLSHKISVLVVDDDKAQCDEIAEFLSERGISVAVAYEGLGALTSIKNLKPSVVIMDVGMPTFDGLKISRLSTILDFRATVILITGEEFRDLGVLASECGAICALKKPLDMHLLLATIKPLLQI